MARLQFCIDAANMFGFWDWVGGRYSMDSAIGLSTMLAVGPENFRAMPVSVRWIAAPFDRNLPVLMGLLAVWHCNFFGAQTVAVLAYEQYLKRFPAYLQELTMESNGKHVSLDGGGRAGKVLAQRIAPELESNDETGLAHDSSTNALMRRCHRLREQPS